MQSIWNIKRKQKREKAAAYDADQGFEEKKKELENLIH